MTSIASADFASLVVAAAAAALICAIGVRVHLWGAGVWSLGPIAFVAAGAYGMGIVLAAGSSAWLAVPAGLGAALLVALLIALPAARLHGEIVAALTVCVGEGIRRVVIADPGGRTGGVGGLPESRGGWPGIESDMSEWLRGRGVEAGEWAPVAGLAVLVSGLAWILVVRLERSAWGTALAASRQEPVLGAVSGLHPGLRRLQALLLGAALCAVAGEILMLVIRPGVGAPGVGLAITAAAVAVAVASGARRWWLPVSAILGAILVVGAVTLDLPVGSDRALGVVTAVLGATVVVAVFAARPARIADADA